MSQISQQSRWLSLDVDAELLAVQDHRALGSLHPGSSLDVADLVRAGELAEQDRLDGEVADPGRGGHKLSWGGRGGVLRQGGA